MSPRLPSARTKRPAARARATGAGSASQPGAPGRSKQAPGDVELAEPGERDLPTAGEGLLDDAEDGVDRGGGVLLLEVALPGDVIDELALRHCGPPVEGRRRGDASSAKCATRGPLGCDR